MNSLGISIALGIFVIALLCVIIPESIKNFFYNIRMEEVWKRQHYNRENLKKCPKCGRPSMPPCTIIQEGLIFPFILKKYLDERYHCSGCGFKVDYIQKWNGMMI